MRKNGVLKGMFFGKPILSLCFSKTCFEHAFMHEDPTPHKMRPADLKREMRHWKWFSSVGFRTAKKANGKSKLFLYQIAFIAAQEEVRNHQVIESSVVKFL